MTFCCSILCVLFRGLCPGHSGVIHKNVGLCQKTSWGGLKSLLWFSSELAECSYSGLFPHPPAPHRFTACPLLWSWSLPWRRGRPEEGMWLAVRLWGGMDPWCCEVVGAEDIHHVCTSPERTVIPQLKVAAFTLQLRKKKKKRRKKLLMRLNYWVIVIQYLKPKFHNCLVISAFMFFVSIMQAAHLVIMKYWKVLSNAHPRFSMSP